MEKTYVLTSEILETETPKNEKLGKIVTRKIIPILQYTDIYSPKMLTFRLLQANQTVLLSFSASLPHPPHPHLQRSQHTSIYLCPV